MTKVKEGRWVVRKYVSGPVVERSRVWVATAKGEKRQHRVKGNTSAKKADTNATQAVKMLARELNANFSETPSLLVGLSYDDGHLPENLDQCRKDAANFLRRFKRSMRAQGVTDIRTVTVVSDMDGETGETVREHIHIVMTGEGISFHNDTWWAGDKKITDIWGKGGCGAKNVRQGGSLTPMAVYLLKQVRNQPDKRKWIPSRNLRKPIVTEETVKTARGELRAPAGVVVLENNWNAETGTAYLRYIKPVKRNEEGEKRIPTSPVCAPVPRNDKGGHSGKGGCEHGV